MSFRFYIIFFLLVIVGGIGGAIFETGFFEVIYFEVIGGLIVINYMVDKQ